MNSPSARRQGVGEGSFRVLDVSECVELLASKRIGRVGFVGPRGPQIIPVNYALRDGTIVLRTAAYSTMAQHVTSGTVAFQVDEVDEFLSSGWSVLALGTAARVGHPEDLAALWAHDEPEPWAAGIRSLFVQITPTEITGRRILPS